MTPSKNVEVPFNAPTDLSDNYIESFVRYEFDVSTIDRFLFHLIQTTIVEILFIRSVVGHAFIISNLTTSTSENGSAINPKYSSR